MCANHWEFYDIEDDANQRALDFKECNQGDVGIVVGRGPSISGEAYFSGVFLFYW